MRKMAHAALVGGLLLLASSGALEAQGSRFLSLGGGATIPTGDFKNDEEGKTGWITGLALGTGVGSGNLFVMASGFYGTNGTDHAPDETITLAGGTLNLGVASRGERARLYGYVGGGLQRYESDHEEDNGTSALGNAAVGVSVGSGKARLWVQGGIALNKTASYFPVMAGVRIGL